MMATRASPGSTRERYGRHVGLIDVPRRKRALLGRVICWCDVGIGCPLMIAPRPGSRLVPAQGPRGVVLAPELRWGCFLAVNDTLKVNHARTLLTTFPATSVRR